MATHAVAPAALSALRRQIARIEGTLPERLDVPADAAAIVRRTRGAAESQPIRTGSADFDQALDGGLVVGALTEIHGREGRDAGAVAGFSLALAARLRRQRQAEGCFPLLWIGSGQAFAEGGFPYAPGLHAEFGFAAGELLFAESSKLADALWIAEEATRVREIAGIFIELCGNPQKLDLTATRRLHRRAVVAGRPVFLMRQSAVPEPTAAPVRLVVASAPATSRATLDGPLGDSIGHPAFAVTIDKSRSARTGQFVLEWNADEHAFWQRRPQDTRPLVSTAQRRKVAAPAPGTVVAFTSGAFGAGKSAAGVQPSREQHPAHRGDRRTG